MWGASGTLSTLRITAVELSVFRREFPISFSISRSSVSLSVSLVKMSEELIALGDQSILSVIARIIVGNWFFLGDTHTFSLAKAQKWHLFLRLERGAEGRQLGKESEREREG